MCSASLDMTLKLGLIEYFVLECRESENSYVNVVSAIADHR